MSALVGDIAIAKMQDWFIPHAIRHLVREGVGFYWPREYVRRRYSKGVKTWSRAFLPCTVFVANGQSGKDTLADYGEFFDGRFWGFTGLLDHPVTQAHLRKELATVERMLGIDPTLSAHEGLVKGVAVRVVAGPFMGMEGYVEDLANQYTFWVRLPIMGASCPVRLMREQIERV